MTTWGVYPLGYMVPALLPNVDMNWLHLAFSVANVVNKVGVGVVAFWAASVYERRHASQDNPASCAEHPGTA